MARLWSVSRVSRWWRPVVVLAQVGCPWSWGIAFSYCPRCRYASPMVLRMAASTSGWSLNRSPTPAAARSSASRTVRLGFGWELAAGLAGPPGLAQQVLPQELHHLSREYGRGPRLFLLFLRFVLRRLGAKRSLASASARSASACRATSARIIPQVVPITPPTSARKISDPASTGPRFRRRNFLSR